MKEKKELLEKMESNETDKTADQHNKSKSKSHLMQQGEIYRSKQFISDLAIIIALEFEFRLRYDTEYYDNKGRATDNVINYTTTIKKLEYIDSIKDFLLTSNLLSERRIIYLINVYHDWIESFYANHQYFKEKLNELVISLELYNLSAKIKDDSLVVKIKKNEKEEYNYER